MAAWRFQPGLTPITDIWHVIFIVSFYLVSIAGLRSLLRNAQPMKFKALMTAHNFFLSISSVLLLVAIARHILPFLWQNGLFAAVCNQTVMADNDVEFLFYVNYLLKIYELVDTYFIVLGHYPLGFLHVYHHPMTLLLTYSQLYDASAVQWVPITLNLIVHSVMYYYYGMTALGHKVWWKKYVTTLQITQFVLDVVAVYYCTWRVVAYGDCFGGVASAYFGCAVLSSYLLLFIQFFYETYLKKEKAKET